MRIEQVNCFGTRAGGGNPALVIEGDEGDPAARQALARLRQTTCVFLRDGVLDYYYPHARSALCLHATLAVARVLFERTPDASTLTVRTAMTGQALTLTRQAEQVFVTLTRQDAPQAPADAATLLGVTPLTPPSVWSVGSPKLLVQVADVAALQGLTPDLSALAAWSRAHGVNGCYAWCWRGDGSIEGRNFNHLDPALEDSATGVAAGALTAMLGHGIVLYQGNNVGRDCRIVTAIDGASIAVGGRAERVNRRAVTA